METREGFRAKYRLRCKKCKDAIYSRREGELVTCKCSSAGIDETSHYVRFLGDRDGMDI